MEVQPKESQEEESRELLAFQEYTGMATDMYGVKVWIAWNSEREYAVWELNYESSASDVELPYYRVNWKPYGSGSNPIEPEQWQHVGDFGDYDAAVAAAETHHNL